jgi:hypothetical protein
MNKNAIKIPKLKITKRRMIISATVIVALFFYGMGNGYLPYAVAAVKCGRAPVTATKFAASYSYVLPGEPGYGPGIFKVYYCTQADAVARGFHPAPGTPTAIKQDQASRQKLATDTKFDASKLNYTAYKPALPNYSYTNLQAYAIRGAQQTFYSLKKDGTIVTQVRQGKIGNEYELCLTSTEKCELAGTDSAGRQIQRVIPTKPQTSMSLTTRIGDTFVNITDTREGFTLTDAIAVFGSMEKIE